MDRLAVEGAYFPNAFVTTSLCSPNRASLLTGAYAHRHGVRINALSDPDPAIPKFPQLLQASGYETAHIGKWHMAPTSAPRPGYDYWLSFKSQGTYLNPTLNENGRIFTQQGYLTDILTDYAIRFLRRARDKPFFLMLSHKAPHSPYEPASRYQKAFATATLPKGETFDDTLADKPKWLRRYAQYGARSDNRKKSTPTSVPKGKLKPKRRLSLVVNYLRMLKAVDDSLGGILDTLEAMDELDKTLVIFTSDNGLFLGEHQLRFKKLMYEESIRVPLIIRYPKFVPAGTIRTEIVASIDIAPTLLHIAGVDVPDTVQGHSLLPLLKNEAVNWRKSLLYEYFADRMYPGIPTILGVRTERWKYIITPDFPEDIDELYDLQNDPNELVNLVSNPQYTDVLATMQAELTRQLQATNYTAHTE
jgi:N-acetylglucosamine-6-sulfatase